MSKKNEWYQVGWVKSAHGIRGELYVQLFSKKADWLADCKQMQLRRKDGVIETLGLKNAKPHKLGLIVKPEGFTTRNQSELWKGSEVLIDKSILQSEDGEVPYLVEFEGFQVRDKVLGVVGLVTGFQDNGAHDILVVTQADGNEALIPFVDAFIEEVQKSEKILLMDLPAGLIDED